MNANRALRRSSRKTKTKITSYKEDEEEDLIMIEEDLDINIDEYPRKKKENQENKIKQKSTSTKTASKRESINRKYDCPVCSEILEDPYLIPKCCHRFCGACIHKSIRAGGQQRMPNVPSAYCLKARFTKR